MCIRDSFLQACRNLKNFAPQFHLSLQSGSDSVLRAMNRRYTRAQYLEKCALIYKYFPEASITTDIIAGFAGETEEDFAQTLDLCRRVRFSQIHCFAYSRRTGTVAAKFEDLPPAIKKRRLHELLALAEELRREYEAAFAGKVLEFVPEERKGEYTVGYSENYIRLYVAGEIARKTRVVALSPYQDGLKAIVKEDF